ncbi:Tm-1-like ATP-binding domain-containing protein [Nocardioides KLBMP 9356]|uniref:Tm-1-like ATP-binding domain-containing protein n=1 Tax=Nocardioides potassii TaxID=2911371 RepID=A0ABS9HDE6_9ACTN|nr:Tm-1-like ATP-binding domain-containing protein [Nocardioides potassii]MCF6378138.1 Tm-1-like ATP-binding domain-containing protein [Nocardioides potassii]
MPEHTARPRVVLLAALDTKADDAAFVRARLQSWGIAVTLVDYSVVGDPPVVPDHSAAQVAELAGTSLQELREARDRSRAVAAMGSGARLLVAQLHADGEVDGVFALGGGAGTTIGSAVMRELPLGMPKVILSTIAAGDTSNYLGTSDIVLFPSVVDVAGVNSVSRLTYTAAADAMAGMVQGLSIREGDRRPSAVEQRPVVAASMFGVTTPAVLRSRELLEEAGCEVVVFHATGAGGRTLERLCAEGHFAAVLDLTTTEWADEVVGGILSAGADRLNAAARAGIPQVVSVGATDMVNFGRPDTVPARFTGRTFYHHNAENTLMRTTVEESRQIGLSIGSRVAASTGPSVVIVPDGGVSALDAPGQPFEDSAARAALADDLVKALSGSDTRVIRTPLHINDGAFAELAVRELLALMRRSDQGDRGDADDGGGVGGVGGGGQSSQSNETNQSGRVAAAPHAESPTPTRGKE